jgi:GNAT superfamily N-acetyltransferase
MSRVAVRTAVVADAPFIARVHLRSWQVGYRGIMPDEVLDAISLEQREERWRQILSGEEEPGFTVVADVDGRGVQGFGSGVSKTRDEDAGERTGEVMALYVEPSRWRCGLGRQLLAEVLDRLQRKGCQEATVWVLAENHGARRFYASVGFAPDGAEGRHDTSGQTKVRLAASLAEPATRPAPLRSGKQPSRVARGHRSHTGRLRGCMSGWCPSRS